MAHLSFDIKSSHDLFSKLIEDHNEFLKKKTSSRIALNCAMTAWHIIDWIAVERNSNVSRTELQDIKKIFKSECPSLAIMQDLCNGTKHCRITYPPNIKKAEKHIGGFSNDFSNDFDISRLMIEFDNGSQRRFEDEIAAVIKFWKEYFKLDNKIIES